MEAFNLSGKEFKLFQTFIYDEVGIDLADSKKPLVSGRLSKRLKHHALSSFNDYYQLISDPKHQSEKQVAIDLLTTNETHFFREPKHFDFLRDVVVPKAPKHRPLRIWSAASSSGEEPYTIAMVLAEHLKSGYWEVFASDVSSRVLAQAQTGCYSIQRAEEIPKPYLSKYCLKGTGEYTNTLLVSRELRQRVKFFPLNLTQPFPALGEFDVIFLRNVMIYFDVETKRKILQQMLPLLRKDGYLLISHSESLNGVTDDFVSVFPAIYRKK